MECSAFLQLPVASGRLLPENAFLFPLPTDLLELLYLTELLRMALIFCPFYLHHPNAGVKGMHYNHLI